MSEEQDVTAIRSVEEQLVKEVTALKRHRAAYERLLAVHDAVLADAAGCDNAAAAAPILVWQARSGDEVIDVATDLSCFKAENIAPILALMIEHHADQMKLFAQEIHALGESLERAVQQQIDEMSKEQQIE